MARTMKTVSQPRNGGPMVLTIRVDPLRIRRGAMRLPAGGVHQTPRRPSLARSRQELRRALNES